MHTCVHAHVSGGAPTHPIPPRGNTPQISKNAIKLGRNQDISILFEDLEPVETSPPMGGCLVWWVGGWVSGSKHVKSLKI